MMSMEERGYDGRAVGDLEPPRDLFSWESSLFTDASIALID